MSMVPTRGPDSYAYGYGYGYGYGYVQEPAKKAKAAKAPKPAKGPKQARRGQRAADPVQNDPAMAAQLGFGDTPPQMTDAAPPSPAFRSDRP